LFDFILKALRKDLKYFFYMLKCPKKDRQREVLSKVDKNVPIYPNKVYIGSVCQKLIKKS